jgi:hypothetical protein
MISISYAILACNEHIELHTLLNKITRRLKAEDEIVVVLDTNSTKLVKALCEEYKALPNFRYYFGALNKDFATHKNFLNSWCTKEWIFNIDADEYPCDTLLDNLHDILTINADVDMIAVPRVNKVNGITIGHIQKWGWVVDSEERVNWPDYQLRLYKNKPEIKWEGKVHERPVGWQVGSHLPCETEDYALIHIKDIQRQEKQNELYNTI